MNPQKNSQSESRLLESREHAKAEGLAAYPQLQSDPEKVKNMALTASEGLRTPSAARTLLKWNQRQHGDPDRKDWGQLARVRNHYRAEGL